MPHSPRMIALILPALLLSACQTLSAGDSPQVETLAAFMARQYEVADPQQYRSAFADLNGDGRFEAIVYVSAPDYCGSGGCNLLVLTPDSGRYRLVTRMTVSRLPVRQLATATNGWRDLGVAVGGGGMEAGEAWMRFDGASYPENPTVAPPTEPDAAGQALLAAR